MLLYDWTIFILYIYIINGRLEADINKSVGFICVLLQVFPPQLVLVARISLCQPGVEDLEEYFFYRAHKSDNINI